jgi:hypothetical protein
VPRLRVAIGLFAGCLAMPLIASCATVVDGTGYPSGAAPSSGMVGFPTSTVGLARFLRRGFGSVTSAHLELRETAAGIAITASGDETVRNGEAKDVSLTEHISNFGTIRIIVVGDRMYAQLPPARRTSSKPWTRLSSATSDPTLQALYQALVNSRPAASVDSATLFVRAARHLRFKGRTTLAGAPAGHYSVVVAVTKLPDSFPQKSALEQVGLRSIPLELWIDTQGRTRKLTEQVSVLGHRAKTDVTLGNFNAPVHISAPPPDQVSDS